LTGIANQYASSESAFSNDIGSVAVTEGAAVSDIVVVAAIASSVWVAGKTVDGSSNEEDGGESREGGGELHIGSCKGEWCRRG